MLMIAERLKDWIIHSEIMETIKKMDEELTKIFEDFGRAVDVETLCLVKKSGKIHCLVLGIVILIGFV